MSKVSNYYWQIICDALDSPELLNEWEAEFIDSIADKCEDERFSLTTKQQEILSQIRLKINPELQEKEE